MGASVSGRTPPLSGMVRRLVGTLGFAAIVCVGTSLTSPAHRLVHAGSPQESGVSSPKAWVHASRTHPVFWWIWAEVRDYLGEDEWRSIDRSWMPARARADLGRVSARWRHEDPYVLAGLWRLGLERERVLERVAAHDGVAAWPLPTPGNRFPLGRENHFPFLWRPRLERWYRAQPAGETAAERLKGELAATWSVAVTTKDVGLAATVVEALDERFGREPAEARGSEALDLVRESVSALEARIRVDPREHWGHVPTALMERFGVSGDVDLKTIVDWARSREERLRTEAIPLPHPYDLHLFVLRLQRLRDRGPTRLPIAGVIRDEQGRPIPHVWIEVEGYPKPLRRWPSDVHGRFQIDDVPRGPVKLLVTTGPFWARSAPKEVLETRAGMRDLVIVLDPGPQLFLRIVDYVPGSQERGARVTWEDPDGKRDWRWAPIRDDGWVRFVALPPDREFEVWAEAEVGRRHVRARGLRPGQTEQRIERQEVQDIAGKFRGSRSERHITADVYAHAPRGVFTGLRVARASLEDDGSFRVRGLPPGTYLVDVGSRAGEIVSVWKSVEAGTTDAIFELD